MIPANAIAGSSGGDGGGTGLDAFEAYHEISHEVDGGHVALQYGWYKTSKYTKYTRKIIGSEWRYGWHSHLLRGTDFAISRVK
jgi:hypothetical protein